MCIPLSLGGGPVEHRWSPYNDNGGTTVAVAGPDYALIASDTRLTDGVYGILSRTTPKLFQVRTYLLKAEIKGNFILFCQ